MAAPQVGAIIDGYKYLGGDPNSQENWQPVGIDEIAAAKVEGATQGKINAKALGPPNQVEFNAAANQLKDIRGARNSAGFWNTGWIGNTTAAHPDGNGKTGFFNSGIAGTPGYNLDKDLGTIKARIMFANLAKMKAASANGASGLGSLSIPEGEALRSTIASLDVGLPAGQLRQNLDRVREDVILNNKGVNTSNPYDLSSGETRSHIPRGAFYKDAEGNIRRNDNGDAGNPIIIPAKGQGQGRPSLSDIFGR